jgi:hypothetical protein
MPLLLCTVHSLTSGLYIVNKRYKQLIVYVLQLRIIPLNDSLCLMMGRDRGEAEETERFDLCAIDENPGFVLLIICHVLTLPLSVIVFN